MLDCHRCDALAIIGWDNKLCFILDLSSQAFCRNEMQEELREDSLDKHFVFEYLVCKSHIREKLSKFSQLSFCQILFFSEPNSFMHMFNIDSKRGTFKLRLSMVR